ncbi:hypothetical protein DPMN_098184 [Dreissena polymorpha]|uniref:Uncharacterized protein n=1 Tax=Dreissena polymorpha TaxID=45954 RepID=A0A9D4R5E4_DREPO|nr:hypothetical protein DPMN_098184 [Dreissena polymorpha]
MRQGRDVRSLRVLGIEDAAYMINTASNNSQAIYKIVVGMSFSWLAKPMNRRSLSSQYSNMDY